MAAPNPNEVKSIITGLVTSGAGCCTIRELCNDFLNFEGYRIPYRELGYNNVEEYLRSIRDTIIVTGTGPNAIVQGVFKPNSAHIVEMVAKQKNTPKRQRKPIKFCPRGRPRQSSRYTWHKPQPKFTYEPSSDLRTPHMKPPNSITPVGVENWLKFNSNINKEVGENSQSVDCENAMLPSISQPNFSHTQPVSSSSSVSQPNFSHTQPVSCPSSVSQPSFSYTQSVKGPSSVSQPNFSYTQQVSSPSSVSQPNFSYTQSVKSSSSVSQPNFSYTQSVKSPSSVSQPNFSYTQPVSSTPSLSQLNLSHTKPMRSPSPPKVNLESVPPISMPVRRSVKDFLENISKEEDSAISASPVVNNHSVSPEPEPEPDPELEDFHPHIPKEVRDNLKKLIAEFPDGIWCSQLPKEYHLRFKRKLHFDRYGYRALIEMCVDLPGIFNWSKPTPEDFLLCDRTKPFPKIDQALIDSTLPEKEIVVTTNILHEISTLTWDSVGEKIAPPDILRLGETVPCFPFGDRFQPSDYLDVVVGEIYDISKFWINLEHGPLTKLMNDLQDFFGKDQNKYLIPEPLLQEGLYCCTLYLGKYHRAVIVNTCPKLEGFVRVFFFDYGTVENVCSNEIWFFPKRFAEIPYQAIRARYSDICPPMKGLPWSRKAINRFNQLITNTVLLADVVQVDQEDNVLDIYLADVSDENHIFYIHNVLIDEGLAVEIDKERKEALVDPKWIIDVTCSHMYPLFREIEAGMAPSLADINYIIANNLPMHHYLPQYFDISYDDDIPSIEDQYEKIIEDPDIVPEINLDEIDTTFDYSCFPSEIVDECADIFQLEESRASIQQTQATVEKVPKQPEVSKEKKDLIKNKNSYKEYSCNRSRVAKMVDGHTKDEEKGEKSTIRNTSADLSQGEIIAPLSASLNNLSFNNTTLPLPRPKSTNPFLNDDSDVCTNPFLNNATNPFLSRTREEEIDTTKLLKIFSKPSEDKVQENIVNNLNPSPTLPRKLKQVNVERSENLRSSERIPDVRPVIRAPPGFNAPLPMANMIPPPMMPMYPDYSANNPYYQRHPQFLWNNTFFLQNQYGMAMVQQNSAAMTPNFMNMPQFNPQMQFNLPYIQQQNLRQTGPRNFAASNKTPPGW